MSSHRRLVYVAGLNVEGYWDVLGGRGMLKKQQRIAKDSRPRTKEDEEKKKIKRVMEKDTAMTAPPSSRGLTLFNSRAPCKSTLGGNRVVVRERGGRRKARRGEKESQPPTSEKTTS